jgi:xanthine dehydrogenase YagS FAD-binding subunit
MTAFTYVRATTPDEAVAQKAKFPDARYIRGGTNLLDLLKMGVETLTHLIDINQLPFSGLDQQAGGLRIGALVSNTDAANHPLIRERYPLLSEAILVGASQQLTLTVQNWRSAPPLC